MTIFPASEFVRRFLARRGDRGMAIHVKLPQRGQGPAGGLPSGAPENRPRCAAGLHRRRLRFRSGALPGRFSGGAEAGNIVGEGH